MEVGGTGVPDEGGFPVAMSIMWLARH
jgi:hypothetical protein